MISTSASYKTAIDSLVRKFGLKAVIDFTSVFLDESIVITAAGDYFSSKAQLANNKTEPSYRYFIIGDSSLDDGHRITGTGLEMGWWSDTRSNADGSMQGGSESITIDFSERNIEMVYVYGDSKIGEYPVDFTIDFYYSGSWHTEVTVVGNTDVEYTYEFPADLSGVTSVRLNLTKWSQGNQYLKILEFFVSKREEYDGDIVESFEILEEKEYEGGSLPVGNISANEMKISIYDDETIHVTDMVQNKPIYMTLGIDLGTSYEYVKLGTFYTKDWYYDKEEKKIEIVAHDLMSILSESSYSNSDIQTNQTLKDLAEAVLLDSQLTVDQYSIDEELDDITVPTAFFETQSHMKSIRQIVEAALGEAYVDRDGVLQLIGPANSAPGASVKTMNDDFHILPGLSNPIVIDKIANVIEVEYFEYEEATGALTVLETYENIIIPAGESETLTLFFNDYIAVNGVTVPVFTQSGSNITISDWTAYSWGISITFLNSGGTDQQVTGITISGKPIYEKVKMATASDTVSIQKYGRHTFRYSNKFVQNLVRAQTIANSLVSVFKDPFKDVKVPTTGDPSLELGDAITLSDLAEEIQIYRQNIKFDGGLEILIEGRKTA